MIPASKPIRESAPAEKSLATTLRSWNVAVGNLFFRYRNALFPVIFLFAVVFTRPRVMFDSPLLDVTLGTCGAFLALAGQGVRLLTIGFEYIHRGGREGRVYAKHLVQGGIYGITRNPMYVGNTLIAVGMTMMAGSPIGYLVIIPFFLFVYQAIIAAEETFLRRKFGAEYEEYCATVHRFLPSFKSVQSLVATMRFDWKRAIRKDLSTIMGLLIGLISIPVWRTYFLHGFAAARAAAFEALIIGAGAGVLYGLLMYLKKRKRFF